MIWNERFGAAFLRDFALCVIMQLSEYHSSLSLSASVFLSLCVSLFVCLFLPFSPLCPFFLSSMVLLYLSKSLYYNV